MRSSRMLERTGPRHQRRTVRFAQVVTSVTEQRGLVAFVAVHVMLAVLRGGACLSYAQEANSPPKVEAAVDGQFLGIRVEDRTRDHFIQNAWLRQAIQDGRRMAGAFRRHQLDAICLLEGQHGASGVPAVMIMLVPKPHETPDPPFEPVAVRRWQPEPGKVYSTGELAGLQLTQPPYREDLDRLRDAISGHRFGEVKALFYWVRITLGFVGVGLALIVLAGAYRCFAYVTTRWDPQVDAKRSDVGLQSLKAARAKHEEQA